MDKVVSIYNDVMGPIMTGPSSSHTAACSRIGLMVRHLYGEEIYNAEIIFEETGSYPNTYIGQGSNYGFTGGLLGYYPDDSRLKDSIEIAKKLGRNIIFKKENLGEKHPNSAKINIIDKDGSIVMSVMTYSIGGGMFEIRLLNGFKVLINGEKPKVFIISKKGDTDSRIRKKLKGKNYSTVSKENHVFFDIDIDDRFDEDIIKEITKNEDVIFHKKIDCILPVELKADINAPFTNANDALKYNKKEKLKMWELAIKYETSIGKISSTEALEKMKYVLDVMRKSSHPTNDSPNEYGFLKPTAKIMKDNFKVKKIVDIGVLSKVTVMSTAIMESNCAHGIIVAAPTAGSCGVVPSSIITVGEEMGLEDNIIIEALLSAGLVGSFIGNNGTFSGEEGGCQAENGSASAMAAAGITYILGGTVEECFQASSLALQNLLGLICDPIAGLTEIPCVNRNVISAANAIISSNMVIAGYDPMIPLDETIIAMKKTGEMLPRELRCTCLGGLCETPTGIKIADEMNKRRSQI